MNLMTRVGVVAGVSATVALVPSIAFAHPLGNATVNRSDVIVVEPHQIAVTHILDLAEIPTVQAMPKLDVDSNSAVTDSELSTYATGICRNDAVNSTLRVDGQAAALTSTTATGQLLAGQAGLQTLRIVCDWKSSTEVTTTSTVDFEAAPLTAAGWREIVVAGDQMTIDESDAPAVSASAGLTAYPQDLLSTPPVVVSTTFQVSPGGPVLAQSPTSPDATAGATSSSITDQTTRWLSSLADGASSPLAAVVALLAAALVGAFHALTPGHGKTAVAFAIAGQEKSRRAAVMVGTTVTATHTASVLVLGLFVATTTAFAPAALYPWLSAASGLLVVVVGAALLRRALQGKRGHVHLGGGHSHTHADHDHPHEHDHSHGHRHLHDDPPHTHHAHGGQDTAETSELTGAGDLALLERPSHDESGHAHTHQTHEEPARVTNRRTLAALGVAGGVVPSPSALLVLLGTAAVGRAWWGVALVVAFGVGMAATLAFAGLVAWRLGERVRHWAARGQRASAVKLARALPVVAAAGVLGAGALVMVRSLMPLI